MGTNKSLTFFVKAAANFAEVIQSIVSFSMAASLPLDYGVERPGTPRPQREEGTEYQLSLQQS